MTYGALCSGIGGLELAVEAVFGMEAAWHSEVNADAVKVHDRHWPDLPNLGDLTAVDWSQVEPVELVCAGYPCQPFSYAGERRGENDDRHLWPHIAEAVRVLRPRWVVLENVAGHLTLGFDAVLGDLAEAGYDTEWACVRASDVGAPHRRERLFVVARDTISQRADLLAPPGRSWGATGEPDRSPADTKRQRGPGRREAGNLAGTARGGEGEGDQRERDGDAAHHRSAASADATGEHEHRAGRAWGRWPEPTDGDLAPAYADEQGPQGAEPAGRHIMPSWGDYEPAIRRWERILGRPAPNPVDDRRRLTPTFVEWMMGYPAGWVDGISRTAALRCLGNAVVPQQGVAALTALTAAWQEVAA